MTGKHRTGSTSLFARGPSEAKRSGRVLLISALPPPWGGVSVLTAALMRRGIPDGFALQLLNTSIWPRKLFEPAVLNLREVRRNSLILCSLVRRLLTKQADIVHYCWTPTRKSLVRDHAIAFFCRLFATPLVLHFHGDFANFDRSVSSGICRRLFLGTLKRATCLIVLSRNCQARARQLISHAAVEFIPNFIETSPYEPARSSCSSQEWMRVIFVGAVCLAKGVWNLLEAATLTQGITFRLAGQAADGFRLQLEAAIEKHGLRERFEILGLVPNDKVPGLMSDSDVFCLPSLEEGFPITVLEAMNCALPIVASRVGNIPEIIEHQIGGILFDPGDVHALVAALEKLRDEPELRRQMGSRNWKRAKECYDYEAFARKLVMIYQSVLNPAPRA